MKELSKYVNRYMSKLKDGNDKELSKYVNRYMSKLKDDNDKELSKYVNRHMSKLNCERRYERSGMNPTETKKKQLTITENTRKLFYIYFLPLNCVDVVCLFIYVNNIRIITCKKLTKNALDF